MRTLLQSFFAIYYQEPKLGKIIIKGRFLSTLAFSPIAFLVFGGLGILAFFPTTFWQSLICILGLCIFIAWNCRFKIQLDTKYISISKIYFGIPFKKIKVPLNSVIINHPRFEHIRCISPRKDYAVDIRNNLQFDYGAAWDEDDNHLSVKFKNKDLYFFWYPSEELLWNALYKAFERIDAID